MVKRLFTLCSLLLALCTISAQQLYMQVEVLQPAEVKLPANVRNLLLINSSPLSGEEPMRCLFAASSALENTDRFDEASVLPQVKTNASVDSLCERYEADALLSLNALVFSGLTANTYWTVYYPGGRQYSFFADTDLTEAEDVFSYVGEQMAFILAPYWQFEDRYLYLGDDPAILAGLDAFRHRNWSAAISLWQPLTTQPLTMNHEPLTMNHEPLTAASAAANIAVALELQDRYAEAESWTAKAINLFSRIHTPDAAQQVVNLRYYQSQLHSRAGL